MRERLRKHAGRKMQNQILRASRKNPFRGFLFPVCLTDFLHGIEKGTQIHPFFGGIRRGRVIPTMGALVAAMDRGRAAVNLGEKI